MGSGCSTELDASSPGAGNGDVAVSAKIHVQSGAFPTAKAIKPLQKEGDFNYASGYTECIRGDGVKGIVLSKDFMKRADELNAQITKLTAGSNSYLAQFGESFVAVHDTLKTIAHLAVPPPGG